VVPLSGRITRKLSSDSWKPTAPAVTPGRPQRSDKRHERSQRSQLSRMRLAMFGAESLDEIILNERQGQAQTASKKNR